MLDIRRIRENLEDIKKAMDRRGEKEFNLDIVVELDDQRRELLKEVEVMKNEMKIDFFQSGCFIQFEKIGKARTGKRILIGQYWK